MAGKIVLMKQQADSLFSKRHFLMSLWQTISDNFYPQRGDFTILRSIGEEYASHLMTSYPVLAHRELGSSFGAMLRPTSKEWFRVRTDRFDDLDLESKQWLEHKQKIMKRAMYDPQAMLTRATSEGDHDFAAYGQTCISVDMNLKLMALLYRCWHLRDVTWFENDIGEVGGIYRRWKPEAHVLASLFKPEQLHSSVNEAIKDNKFLKEFEILHCVVPTELYDSLDKEFNTPFVSVYLDCSNMHEIECVGQADLGYILPRWQTVSGSQYAFSPATITALPEARMIQSMTRVLLEAGEKAVDPPMIAAQDQIRSDIAIYAGGVTYFDAQYDERSGEVMRPISQNFTGIPLGIDMARDARDLITEAFYLNKLSLPTPDVAMTAFEVGQRVQEYIRQALPLFEPMEMQYNGQLCDMTFARLHQWGAFGSPHDMPKMLRRQNITFQFESPLHDAVERAKGQRFIEGKSMIREAAELDPGAAYMMDANVALRDVLEGIGVPPSWTRSNTEIEKHKMAAQAAEQQRLLLENMKDGAIAAEKISNLGGGGSPDQRIQ